ncbi:transcription termination factor Rho [Diplocloster agilis]|uniref:transcription termination factor Rho n=1 Tax=Diplocloster agilis TaxID=2850323 RepID=UPI00082184AB|nr:transcription termination factor Rho [Suonthocola fibrivorans]MCU6735020.1 transcription termination factor Rho [Suonthocola fibrivorans]SCJ61775.1 Transcription termination factor Rho [uncultured Clostridium sp.]
MNREKYESLSLAALKDIAKARGMKGTSGMRKGDLIQLMLAEDQKAEGEPATAAGQEEAAQEKEEMKQDKEEKQAEKPLSETKKRVVSSQQRPRYKNQSRIAVRTQTPSREENGNQTASREESRNQAPSREETRNQVSSREETRNQAPSREETRNQTASRAEERNQAPSREESRNQAQSREEGRSQTQFREDSRTQAQSREDVRFQTQPESREEKRQDNREDRQDGESRANVPDMEQLDSGVTANGILEVLPDGYGFIRCANYLPGENDVYVSPSQIRRFNLKTGDILCGNTRIKTQQEKFSALLYLKSINGFHPSEANRRFNFEDMTPIFPNKRLRLERSQSSIAMRIVDVISPIGKGQRGMIVSPPKAGKTTLLKDVAKSIITNNPEMHLIILLIDERPEEVTDIKEAIEGQNVEVIYSTFDELPEHHKRVSEMVIERAKRLVEHRKDVVILLDSITRLARAYNLTVPPSGRTLSGGLDPAALHMPKRFFGAARNMREGGSLTILATALVDTGSKMDDVVYEEFKGTGNMELVLDRKLQEKRIFPAIDIQKSSTRREDLLLTREEQEAVYLMRKALNGLRTDEAVENILNMFVRTKNNMEFVQMVKKTKFI